MGREDIEEVVREVDVSSGHRVGLVLSGGGARGAYQAGVLRGIAERLKHEMPFRIITGVSAGAINAASLASHRGSFGEATELLSDSWRNLEIEEVFQTNFGSMTWSLFRWVWMLTSGGLGPVVKGIFNTAPLSRYLSGAIDFSGIGENIESGRLRALGLSTTSYRTGRTVTFVDGEQGIAPWARARRHAVLESIGVEHVMASAALPLLFPAIQIGNCFYGDGSIRQSSPLAPAIHLGAERLLAISLRYPTHFKDDFGLAVYPPPAKILGMMMHGVFLDALENDAERLGRINRTLAHFPEGVPGPENMRKIELFLLRPSQDLGKLATDLKHELPRTIRVFTRGLGSSKNKSLDFLSYVLFVRGYTERLLELGYEDALRQWDEIERFLVPGLVG